MIDKLLTRIGWPRRWVDVSGSGEYREAFWCPRLPSRGLVAFLGFNGGLIGFVLWMAANAPK